MRPILKGFDRKIFIDWAWKQYNSKFIYLLEPLNNWGNVSVIVILTEQLSSFYDSKSFNTEECVSSVPAWANFLHLERRKVYCLITRLIRMKKLRKLDRNACDDVRKIRQRYGVKIRERHTVHRQHGYKYEIFGGFSYQYVLY